MLLLVPEEWGQTGVCRTWPALPALVSRRPVFSKVIAREAQGGGGAGDASAPCRSSERRGGPSGAHRGADGKQRQKQCVCLAGGRGDRPRAAAAGVEPGRVNRPLQAEPGPVVCAGNSKTKKQTEI